MPLKEPAWWYGPQPPLVMPLLRHLSRLYGSVAERRFRRVTPYRSRLPVICVGNFTAGGTGKTPLVIRIVDELKALGEHPTVLTRGYGGRTSGPKWVSGESDAAADVGDEALLLAAHAPTLISADRKAGARAIEATDHPCTVIVMDDGLQNPKLAKDLTMAVIDARRGIGNGEVIPAGPLRAPLQFQLGIVDAIVINGAPSADWPDGPVSAGRLKQDFPGPVLSAQPRPKGDVSWIGGGARVVAYAGIGNPERFFALLAELGADIAETIAFADHHAFSEADAGRLSDLARALDAQLITTEKDLVRLRGTSGRRRELYSQSRVLAIELGFHDREAVRLTALLSAALKRETPQDRPQVRIAGTE